VYRHRQRTTYSVQKRTVVGNEMNRTHASVKNRPARNGKSVMKGRFSSSPVKILLFLGPFSQRKNCGYCFKVLPAPLQRRSSQSQTLLPSIARKCDFTENRTRAYGLVRLIFYHQTMKP
jgi:hypothetical protein